MRTRRPILAILCVLANLLVPGIASASTASGAETRVWAFDIAEQVRIGVDRSLTLELHRRCEPTYDQLASDSLLAARGGARTPITSGAGRAGKTGTPNSIYEQVDDAGRVRSRTFYDENGRPFSRQDFDHPHGGIQPHEHNRLFDANGRPITPETVRPLPTGDNNNPSGSGS